MWYIYVKTDLVIHSFNKKEMFVLKLQDGCINK